MLANKALAQFEAGAYRRAGDLFEKADALCHSPMLLVYAARSRTRLGELVLANDLYQQALDEPIGPTLSRPFLEAIEAARTDKKALWSRLPLVELVVTGPPRTAVRGHLDGHPFELAKMAEPLVLDAGEHHFELVAPGYQRAKRVIHLVEGQRLRLDFALAVEPGEAPSSLPPVERWLPVAASFGVGIAGLAVGTVTGIVAATEASGIEDGCVDDSCLASDAARASVAGTLGTVSTVAFIVGAAGVGAGVGLLLFHRPGTEPPRTSLRVGPGSIVVRGAF
ncbi:MAG: hypothetical protein WKG00_25110 [Polyangiaceae bacterium]